MLTPQHSFGLISQRNRCVLPGNARGANHNLRRRCADAICKTSRAAFAHLDRGADPALRAFKNGSRHDVADRIFAPSKPQLFALRLEAEQQCAARCMLACGAGLFVRSVGKFQTAEQIACCGAERTFSKPQRFEAGDSQCSVLDRSSPVPPGSIASNRSTFGGGEGWIKRSQELRHFQPGALLFIAGEVRHPLTFGGIRAIFVILVHGRFRQWLSFVNRQTCRSFQLQRYFGHRGVGRAELEKAGVRRLAAVGNNLPPLNRGYFFIRLFLRPWADCGCWALRDVKHRPRSLRSAALEVRRLIDRFRSQQREFLRANVARA